MFCKIIHFTKNIEKVNSINLHDTDECSFCLDLHVTEDIEHIFCECPQLMTSRLQILGSPFFDDLDDSKSDVSNYK